MEMSFKGFSSFRSGDHFVQQSRTILAILVNGDKRILKSEHWPRRRCLKFFYLFLALAAILFSRAELFSNFGKGS